MISASVYQRKLRKHYELTDHLGNVRTVITDRKLMSMEFGEEVLQPEVIAQNNYYPFGMMMPGRSFSNSTGYRYGFNGMEMDDEVKGGGNSLDFGARMYNSRIARFSSMDPLFPNYPWVSPFVFAMNSPIRFIDFDGMGPEDRIKAALKFLKTLYKQQTELELRTGSSEKALEYMDCSELICRVLAADKITDGVKNMPTEQLINYMASSAWEVVEAPKPGDIILWKGHTALVESYDSENKRVYVIHATKYKKKSTGEWIQSVVQEDYSMNYYEKKGAKFYRPVSENSPEANINESADVNENPQKQSWLDSFKGMWNFYKWASAPNSSKHVSRNIIKTKYKVIVAGLNVRNSSGGGNDIWDNPLVEGDVVTATGNKEGTWIEVNIGDKTGWISSKEKYVETTD